MRIFATSFAYHGQLSGELQCFDPSENLVNSSMRAIRLMAVPPVEVEYVVRCIRMMAAPLHIFSGVSRFSHSYAYGYTRTFRLRVSEGSHSCCVLDGISHLTQNLLTKKNYK